MLSDDDEFNPLSLTPKFFDYLHEDLGCVIFNQTHLGKPAIMNGSKVDLVPFNPRGVAFTRVVGEAAVIDTSSALERISLVLLGSQLSTAAFRTGLELPAKMETGGLPQSLLCNLSLIQYPTYLITEEAVVKCSEKKSISGWFLDSCLFGAKELYANRAMKVDKRLAREIPLATAEVGLAVLALGAAGKATVEEYSRPLPLMFRLAKTYGFGSPRLMRNWLAYAVFAACPGLFGLVKSGRRFRGWVRKSANLKRR